MTKIDRAKLSLIHVAKTKLGLDDEDYRTILKLVAGVTSSRDLDALGYAALMREFKRLGFESDFAKANLGEDRRAMASPGQIAKVRELWSAVTDGDGTDQGLDTWIEKRFDYSALRFIPKHAVNKVIGGLNGWLARKTAKPTPA